MIRHCVMLRLRADHDIAECRAVMAGLAELVDRLPGATGIAAGPNRDFEHKTADYPYGFTIDFETPRHLAAYAAHPDHANLGARLVALCDGGAGGIAVFDIEVTGTPG